MLTDNKVLVNKLSELPALMCAQRRATKSIPDEDAFVQSNIESFGNSIGQTTNWITSMYEVRSRYEKGSPEWDVLSYRIQCGQLYQQNEIDKAKGIVCKPMPKTWHDRHAANRIEDEQEKELYRNIVADKKPYFMRYIYPALMKQYNTYIKNTSRNSLREFQMTVLELKALPSDKLTDRQKEFLTYYDMSMPVGVSDCVMNKICRRFEEEFDGHVGKHNAATKFDYSVMKSDAEYSEAQMRSVRKLYNEYNRRVRSYMLFADYDRVDSIDAMAELIRMNEEFREACDRACPNEEALCNIVLDICYARSSTKKFAWEMCGDTIIQNLLDKHSGIMSFPSLYEDGEILYGGQRYTLRSVYTGVDECLSY